ncbi:MAG: 4-(cytidine 5'-diphospho)-2-C-methyl-D-erythritol kinase [Pseudomonadota bacterium]
MDNNAGKTKDSEVACAKINLALHVRKRLANGYHELETVFAFVDCGDVLHVEPADTISLFVSGPFGDGLDNSSNLVAKAAELLGHRFDVTRGAKLLLEKNLPIASGIGGGSADAAAALRLLNRFWNLNLPAEKLATISASLGADVPACVMSRSCIGRGIGQDLSFSQDRSLSGIPVLLINPLLPVSTPDIFKAWDGVDQGPLAGPDFLTMALSGSNGLTKAAADLQPIISEILNLLETTRPVMSRMSGSGATCFGLYPSDEEREQAAAFLRRSAPDMWIMSGELK